MHLTNSVLGIRRTQKEKLILQRSETTKIKKSLSLFGSMGKKSNVIIFCLSLKTTNLLYILFLFFILEIILLENFESAYLNAISKKIEDYSLEYHEIYTQCYDQIEGYAQSSIQSP